MPVDTRHPDYLGHQHIWQRIRDVLAGEDAVKEAGERYLPRLKGQSYEDYAAYQARGTFHDATSRTVHGLVGAIFRKAPTVDGPESHAELLEDVTSTGVPAAAFAKTVVREVIALGRYGVLVDAPVTGGRAYAVGYAAESIVNWREETVAGRPTLSLVVLRETMLRPKAEDLFVADPIERYRVLRLVPGEGAQARPVYTQAVYQRGGIKRGDRGLVLAEGPFAPRRRGRTLDFIPFQFFAPSELDSAVQKSVIYGLVNANLAHFVTTVDLKHGAHFTALPTPVIAGNLNGGEPTELQIGSGVVWQLEEGARWGMLEFSGAGLGALRQIREDEKRDMAVLGARLLEDQKAAVEAAATVMLRHRGENSLLASISDTVGRGLSRVLGWLVWWSGGPEAAVRVALSKDFFEKAMTPAEMVKLIEGWQLGGYGPRVVFENLREGERLPDDMSFEEWRRDRAARAVAEAVPTAED
jgi:hypothetical protein